MLLSQPIISLHIGLLKQFIWKTWNYQYEMDFQWLKMKNKIKKKIHINFLKSSFLALEIFQCILLLNFWFDDALYFYFYFDIIIVICFESTCKLHMHDKKQTMLSF